MDENEFDENDLFAAFDKEFLKFDRVRPKLARRPDLHAFLLLEQLAPGKAGTDLVACAEHDQIWLDVDVEKLRKKATPAQLRDLHRCGVRYDSGTESLAMFV